MPTNPYSDWQDIDRWIADVPEEYEVPDQTDPNIAWDLNKDGKIDVSDLVVAARYGYDFDELGTVTKLISGGSFTGSEEEFLRTGAPKGGPQLALGDLGSMYNIYATAMEGMNPLTLDDYSKSQYSTSEDAIRKTYSEDYNIFQQSLSSEAYKARNIKKGSERALGMAGLSSGRQETRFKLNKEAYVDEISRLRLDMENRRLQAEVDIFGQRQGYVDYLSSAFGDWSSQYPEFAAFDVLEAMSCLDRGGYYSGHGCKMPVDYSQQPEIGWDPPTTDWDPPPPPPPPPPPDEDGLPNPFN